MSSIREIYSTVLKRLTYLLTFMQSPAPPPWARLFLVFAAYWPSFQTGVSYRGRLGVYRVPRRLQSKSCAFQSSLYPFPPPIHPFFSHLHPFLSAACIVRSREASPSISRVVSPFLRPPTTRVSFHSRNPSRDCASRNHATPRESSRHGWKMLKMRTSHRCMHDRR